MCPSIPLFPKYAYSFAVQQVVYPAFIDEIGRLRYQVWVDLVQAKSSFFKKGKWLDEYDPFAYHWVVREREQLIAAARLSVYDEVTMLPCFSRIPPEALPQIKPPVASLNRLVVHPDYRGHNLSALLDEQRINFARELNVETIVGEPVLLRIKALQKWNFNVYEPVYFIPELPGVPVKFMAGHF